MPRKPTWTPALLESGLVALGTSNECTPNINEACLKALQLLRNAINTDRQAVDKASKQRLQRSPFDAKAQRIRQLEAMVAQYEPVAAEQEKLGFKTTRTKVDAWQTELRSLQATAKA